VNHFLVNPNTRRAREPVRFFHRGLTDSHSNICAYWQSASGSTNNWSGRQGAAVCGVDTIILKHFTHWQSASGSTNNWSDGRQLGVDTIISSLVQTATAPRRALTLGWLCTRRQYPYFVLLVLQFQGLVTSLRPSRASTAPLPPQRQFFPIKNSSIIQIICSAQIFLDTRHRETCAKIGSIAKLSSKDSIL
jgi:hypothetical protein